MGEVNLASLEEHGELSERHAFLSAQKEDLERSLDDLAKAIQRINRTTRERFSSAFEEINAKFSELFPRLFQGGRAQLRLMEEENLLESGVEIFVQLPGKKALPLHSLSGGESALTAISLIFSIFLVKPSPFCLLDEVDAPLDDANVDRFNGMVREMSSQVPVPPHHAQQADDGARGRPLRDHDGEARDLEDRFRQAHGLTHRTSEGAVP